MCANRTMMPQGGFRLSVCGIPVMLLMASLSQQEVCVWGGGGSRTGGRRKKMSHRGDGKVGKK